MLLLYHLLALGLRMRGVAGFIFCLIAISLGRLRAPQARCSRFLLFYLIAISLGRPRAPQARRSRFYIYLIVISFGGPKAGGSASKCQPGKLGLQINMQKILESRLLRNKAQKKIGRKCPMPERG